MSDRDQERQKITAPIESIGEAERAMKRAHDALSALCKDPSSWRLSVPVRPDDPDILLSRGLRAGAYLRQIVHEGTPTRGDVGAAEATRDPIFLLQSRRWHFSVEGIPAAIEWSHEAEGFVITETAETENPTYLAMRDVAALYPDNVREEWLTESVWFTREEATAFGESTAYNFPDGWRVYCTVSNGDLARVLSEQTLRVEDLPK